LYQVVSFTESSLALCLSNDFTTVFDIQQKPHFAYLVSYLGQVSASTIVQEENYISKDYLHDYTSYYSLCFKAYPKYCKRIHFFRHSFDTEAFENVIEGTEPPDSFIANYLGFIVVRPIPHTVIGFTVLKTHQGSPDMNFWGAKKYSVNLFGLSLEVLSLAFQEQDSVVAACATAAMWSMLHGAAQNSNHTILLKSPSEITRDAGNSSDGNRLFPNKGLEISQISESIIKSGLVSEIKDKLPIGSYAKKIINAYSGIGIPIILVVEISDQDSKHEYHAIAVCGHQKQLSAEVVVDMEVSFMSDNITKLYGHDDQWGPFVSIAFTDDDKLITPWNEDNPAGSDVEIRSIIVSVYPKIRISYEEIEPLVTGYDFILSKIFNEYLKQDLVWDIRLVMNKDYKQMLQEMDPELYPKKLQLLTESRPKYIWVASCYVSEIKILDFTFDATGVAQEMLGLNVISYLDDSLNDYIVNNLTENRPGNMLSIFKSFSSERYYSFLQDELMTFSSEYSAMLSEARQ